MSGQLGESDSFNCQAYSIDRSDLESGEVTYESLVPPGMIVVMMGSDQACHLISQFRSLVNATIQVPMTHLYTLIFHLPSYLLVIPWINYRSFIRPFINH